MRNKFREQISYFDCVPTTFINALVHLIERKHIPPLVIQKIYLYTLDYYSRGRHSLGTTDSAIELICQWLNNYSNPKFSISAIYYQAKEVHLGKGNPISACLNRRGVALLNVNFAKNDWHCILALKIEKGWMYCFDPLGPRKGRANTWEIITEGDDESGANIKILCSWLDLRSSKKKFSLGSKSNRSCVLMHNNRK